jgi:hypothetical protein
LIVFELSFHGLYFTGKRGIWQQSALFFLKKLDNLILSDIIVPAK